jgi:hypothetical protein
LEIQGDWTKSIWKEVQVKLAGVVSAETTESQTETVDA